MDLRGKKIEEGYTNLVTVEGDSVASSGKLQNGQGTDLGNVAVGGLSFNSGDSELQLPAGTTAERPSSPSAGYMRWNSTDSRVEVYTGTRWAGINLAGLQEVTLGNATATVTANDAVFTFAYSFQGSDKGYTTAMFKEFTTADIDRFSLVSDGNGTDVLNLTVARRSTTGSTSPTHGYYIGGSSGNTNVIDKFLFSSEANATDVGDAISSNALFASHSSSSHGYASGNAGPSTDIQKYSFATDGNSSKTADLTVARHSGAGASSSTHGYCSGDDVTIDKFSFATDSNATDVGDLIFSRYATGQSSTTHGYHSGGFDGSSNRNEIEKYSFSSDGNSTDVGDLTVARRDVCGISSVDSGYLAGGFTNDEVNIVDKFSFSSDGNATDVGDLSSIAQTGGIGTQV